MRAKPLMLTAAACASSFVSDESRGFVAHAGSFCGERLIAHRSEPGFYHRELPRTVAIGSRGNGARISANLHWSDSALVISLRLHSFVKLRQVVETKRSWKS